jgi:V/A-type H+-transporting ATPase subunit I
MGSVETQGEEELGAEAHEGAIGQSLFESGDLVIRLLSNSVSYSRILALLTAHWALLLVTYSLAALVGTGIGGTAGLIVTAIIIVAGNIFVIALEGLIVFIHSLRLHFYEWFTKFYKGTGTEFHPFKQNNVYTDIALKEQQD